jgi:hypothetical protein
MAPETPVVIDEYYRRIENLVCHADKLYVLTSEGIRRGEERIKSVGWLVVSAESGQILDSLTLDLPVTLETVIKASFDGHTMYLLGRESGSAGENELFNFAVPSSSEH